MKLKERTTFRESKNDKQTKSTVTMVMIMVLV